MKITNCLVVGLLSVVVVKSNFDPDADDALLQAMKAREVDTKVSDGDAELFDSRIDAAVTGEEFVEVHDDDAELFDSRIDAAVTGEEFVDVDTEMDAEGAHPNTAYTKVGFGYGQGNRGAKTNHYCKMYVSFADCRQHCNTDDKCTGFDAEQIYSRHWQQCCIRTTASSGPGGWDFKKFTGGEQPIVQGSMASGGQNQRVVMKRNCWPGCSDPNTAYTQVGFGYGQGKGGATTNHYCKMYVSFADCRQHCNKDDKCTGFDAEQIYSRHWQQCCIRTTALSGPGGWDFKKFNGGEQPIVQGSMASGGQNNRVVMKRNCWCEN